MGAETRLFYSYSKPCSFPSFLQVGTEHRCSFPIITVPYCLANQRCQFILPLISSLPEDRFLTFSTARSTETNQVDTGFTAWCTSGVLSATRTSSPGWPGNFAFQELQDSRIPASSLRRRHCKCLSFPSQSSCFHREGWNAADSPKRSGRRKIL